MKHKSNSVQALRGITFLAVFFYHARLIPNGGGWGVSVFFVLSGFLLMYRNFEDNVYVSMKESILYSMNKIKKMYPLHVITMVMALPWMYFRYQGQEDIVMDIVSRIFVNVLLVQSWFPWESIRYSLNNLSWFLCCLVFMYFMFPLIHRWIKQQKSTRCIRNTVIVICVWMLLYALVIYYVFGNKDMEFVKGLTYNFPIYRLGDFTVGCLSGALCKGHVIERSFKVITIFEGIGMLIFVMMIFVDWGGIQAAVLVGKRSDICACGNIYGMVVCAVRRMHYTEIITQFIGQYRGYQCRSISYP